MTGFTAELTGNGRNGLAPFGIEIFHEGGIQRSPMVIQPIPGITPEGYVDPYFLS
jgi:hypothetical protein